MVIDADERRHADRREVDAEGVDPEGVRVLGIAAGDVAGDAFIEAEAREQAEGGGDALLAMQALFGGRRELRGGEGELERAGVGHPWRVTHAVWRVTQSMFSG